MSSSSRKMLQAAAGNAGGGDFYPYTVDYSVRFDGSSSLSRTFTTPTDSKKYTFSVWLKLTDLAQTLPVIFSAVGSAGVWEEYIATYINVFRLYNGSGAPYLVDTAVRRDSSSWYHLHAKVDTTQATASNRMVMTVNGTPITVASSSYPSQNASTTMNSAVAHRIGYFGAIAGDYYFDGYMSDFVFVDGTAYSATDFGEEKNGVWIPKDPSGLTFGNNGFWLDFSNSAALGTDVSGNGNNFTSSGLTSSDQMIDTPTNNFPTYNTLSTQTYGTQSDGNLQNTGSAPIANGTMAIPSTGKWYAEFVYTSAGSTGVEVGINRELTSEWVQYQKTGSKDIDTVTSAYGASWTTGDIIGVAVDRDANTITFYKNNVSQGAISYTMEPEYAWVFAHRRRGTAGTDSYRANFGQDSSFSGYKTAQGNSDANDIGDFYYAPPADHLALCTANLPEPTIGPNSDIITSEVFDTVLYTGNGTAIGSGGKTISDLEFQPDWVWIKNRDATDSHRLFNAVRGATKYTDTVYSAGWLEVTNTESLTSFTSNGFTLGNEVGVNTNAEDYVAWCWKMGGSGSSNTDGATTSTVSANTDAGISYLTYTGGGSPTTVGHGLGVTPDVMILSKVDVAGSIFLVQGLGIFDNYTTNLRLNVTDAAQTSASTFISGASSSTVSLSTSTAVTQSGTLFQMWCLKEVEGFSKFGKYTGNGSATNGPFIYTGMRPAYILVKQTNGVRNWYLTDTSRDPYNSAFLYLATNLADAEGGTQTVPRIDILSNGFKIYTSSAGWNASGGTYIFMAFSEMPFKYSNAR